MSCDPSRARIISENKLEDQLDDEMRFHIEMRTQEFISAANDIERSPLPCHTLIRQSIVAEERTRDMNTIAGLKPLWQDLALMPLACFFGLPIFTSVAVLSLALGIGANTAIFSLIDAVLFESLPGPPAGTTCPSMGKGAPLGHRTADLSLYSTFAITIRCSRGCGISCLRRWNVNTKWETEPMTGQFAFRQLLFRFRHQSRAGRIFSADDDRIQGGNPVAVISLRPLERKIPLSIPPLVGKVIRIFGHPFTIIGVTQPEFLARKRRLLPRSRSL